MVEDLTTHQAQTNEKSGLAPQDDLTKMKDVNEKKRTQDRIAQRNYRQNVKRKIQDLEQQVANQANLLASRGVALSPTQVESLSIEPGYISQDRPANNFIQGRRSHELIPEHIARQGKQYFEPKEMCNNIGTPHLLVKYPNEPSAEPQNNVMAEHGMDDQSTSSLGRGHGTYAASELELDDYALSSRSDAESDKSRFPDDLTQIGTQTFSPKVQLHNFNPSPLGTHSAFSEQFCGYHEDGLGLLNSQGRGTQPSTLCAGIEQGVPPLLPKTTLEERIDDLIEYTKDIGFESFDSAIIAYFTAKLDQQSTCSIAQRLGRKRCPPQLLQRLRAESDTWAA
ncbi:hypothetical protein B0O99DRAFT_590552 [Bisporella sp. PMI_857]|nr:hypothetical protein B0O99DRAFT_590552 [Bisporella sp. PMI_857]